MFDNFLIRRDSLKNVVEDGKAVGYKLGVRIADYRGQILSLHNGYYICVDGVVYPREVQKFEINGKSPRTFEELKTCYYEHWNYDDEGTLYVAKEGGLEPGVHKIDFQQSILNAYGYRPTDEEWVKNPPVPGSGASAGKTSNIVSYEIELTE
jgi:hypothetical protein